MQTHGRPAPDHVELIAPSTGQVVPPRAHLTTDAAVVDLCGRWDFRWHPHAAAPAPTAADDGPSWSTIDVPSHWVLRGDGAWGRPAYTNTRYPFPVDPPHVPDENPTGDYRRTVEVPADLLASGRLLLRLDGVESLGRVWVNDQEVGVVRGSRLRTELDVTDQLRAGSNTVLIRVHQWSAMSYVEDQDQWWLPGIFREVALVHRPEDGLDDVWLRADRDPASGHGTLEVELGCRVTAYPVTVSCPELGLEVRLADPSVPHRLEVGPVESWSADAPRLYEITVTNAAETVSVRTGFRRVEVVGDAWLVNGRRLRLRGVNRHDIHPERGRVFDLEQARADLLLMKRSNLNAVRTAHYPPHPALLDLADEIGLWVIDEGDLETHGFEPLGWADNPSADPAWREVYLDRVRRLVERDKNHPSVIAWSLGNESGSGANLAATAAWVRRRDPGRSVLYENDHDDSYVDVVTRMYAPVEELIRLTRERDGPIVLCEYLHAMGNGAGGIEDYERAFTQHPALHGGLVWEWRDHGLLARTPEGIPYHAYGGDFGEDVHDGSFVCDGLLLSDGTPTPMLAELAAAVTPVPLRIEDGPTGHGLTVRNLRHDGSTADLVFAWTHEHDGHGVASGIVEVPELAPGASATVPLPRLGPDLGRQGSGEHWLTVTAALSAATDWAPAGHVVSSVQTFLGAGPRGVGTAASVTAPVARPVATESGYEVGQAVLDRSGRLVALGGLTMTGGEVTLWRAPTENDSHDVFGSYEIGPPGETGGFGLPGPSSAARWREAGLDRIRSRVVTAETGQERLRLVHRLAAAGSADFALVEQRWSWVDDALRLEVDVQPSAGWPCTWPRVGVHLRLPTGYAKAEWFGTGPLENYPDSRAAARVGRFTSAVDDLVVPYAVPQETGHRAELRDLLLSGPDLPDLVVTTEPVAGHRPGFVVARHSAHQWTGAAHQHELPAPSATHLYLDLAQHGLGSRACGPDVRPEHALWPRALSATVLLRVR